MHSGSGADYVMTTSLLLASASPRRRQIIAKLGLPFTFCVSPADEDMAAGRYRGPGEGLAPWLAKHKLASVLNLPEAADRIGISAYSTHQWLLSECRRAAPVRAGRSYGRV